MKSLLAALAITLFSATAAIAATPHAKPQKAAPAPAPAPTPSADENSPIRELKNGVMIVSRDYGGSIAEYLIRYVKMRNENTKLAINGECDSACTLFFGFIPQTNICVTDKAKLGIHRSNRPEGTMVMMGYYPLPVKIWIMDEGITEDIKYVPDDLVQGLFSKCPAELFAPPLPKGEKVD